MSSPLPTDAIVAVVGAGTMGRGIAQVAATAGHPVLLFDAVEGFAEKAVAAVRSDLERAAAKGKAKGDPNAIANRITPVGSIEDLAPARLAIEVVVEQLPLKIDILRQLEAILAADAILATNTSSFSVTQLGGALERPERLVGMHFFNPAPVLKLVEVVRGLASDPAIVDLIVATAAAWGKEPIVTASTPGFIVNRVARPFYGEALRLLEEGAADHRTIDQLVTEGGRFRMGPFALTDLIGQDVNYAVTCSVFEAFHGDWRYRPSLLQKDLVDAGRLGRKSGRGWYAYPEEPVEAHAAQTASLPARITVVGDLGPAELLVERIASAGVAIDREGVSEETSYIRLGDVRLALTDGRTAAERGQASLALFDLSPDYAAATAIAVAGSSAGVEAAKALFGGIGITAVPVADLPGLVVARLYAMLINEAADAVHLGVASGEAVDKAMRAGVNYPVDLLAFGDRIGPKRVRQTIDALANFYREPRYRASARLRLAELQEGSLR